MGGLYEVEYKFGFLTYSEKNKNNFNFLAPKEPAVEFYLYAVIIMVPTLIIFFAFALVICTRSVSSLDLKIWDYFNFKKCQQHTDMPKQQPNWPYEKPPNGQYQQPVGVYQQPPSAQNQQPNGPYQQQPITAPYQQINGPYPQTFAEPLEVPNHPYQYPNEAYQLSSYVPYQPANVPYQPLNGQY